MKACCIRLDSARSWKSTELFHIQCLGTDSVLDLEMGERVNLDFLSLFFSSVDPFSKKDWYDVKAPAMFNIRNLGKTLVTRTQGTSE